jgi:hypothetical protein
MKHKFCAEYVCPCYGFQDRKNCYLYVPTFSYLYRRIQEPTMSSQHNQALLKSRILENISMTLPPT